MAKLPYGFDATMPYVNDADLQDLSTEAEAWARLDDLRRHLLDQKPLPPELAHWLGEAIKHSGRNRERLLQELGLKRWAGEKGPYSRRFKEYWQGKLWHLGTYNETGRSADAIVAAAQAEMTAEGVSKIPTRETLQDWLKEAMTGNTRTR